MSSEEAREIPWVEKYRPRSLTEVVSQTLTIQSLQEFVKKRTLPHMIFTGPAGTGKTSTALSLINDLIGKDKITQDAVLEKNASDDVRMESLEYIKNFVFHTGIQENTSFKFVVLDEADNIPKDVQSAFRRIIEMAPPNVKFIFMCNYVEKMIDPVLSRCAIFRFYPLSFEDFSREIQYIAKNENVQINKGILDAIFFISQGDMRQAINLFQMVVANTVEQKGKKVVVQVDATEIYEISGYFPPHIIDQLILACEQRNLARIIQEIDQPRGFSSRALIRQIMDRIFQKKLVFPKLELVMKILAEYDYRLTLEADPKIQLHGMFAEIISTLS